jgi:Rieske Fe-S protein
MENRGSGPSGANVSRRSVLAGVAAAGTAGVLTACSGAGGGGAQPTGNSEPATTSSAPVTVLISQVPVGGGTILAESRVVVTQPTSGTFKAFSATCTHLGCLVNNVSGGSIHCPCHGSSFSITDGAVRTGPAQSPLPAKVVTANGGSLTVV